MKKAKFETPCWIWPFAANKNGYGNMQVDNRITDAHRFMYEFLIGPVPFKTELDHLCKIRLCVNPTHLEPVSHAENCRRGRNSKLTGEDVTKIRTLAAKLSHREIAEMFGVSRTSVDLIMNGKRWASDGQPKC